MSAATQPALGSSPIPLSDRFTTIPKVREICPAGVPAALIPTYAAIADFANNTTGECWPLLRTLARILGKSFRTIQRHVDKLDKLGLIEILERRRRDDGTFLGYKFRLPHIAAAAARIRERREANQRRYEKKKRQQKEQREHRRRQRAAHRPKNPKTKLPDRVPISGEEGARRRREGYEWFFDRPLQRQAGPDEEAGSGAPDPYAQRRDDEPPLDQLPDPKATLGPSTGHECPVDPIYATSSTNHIPPNPPKGGSTQGQIEEQDTSAAPAGEGMAIPDDHSSAELAWSRLACALLDRRSDLDVRDLVVVSLSLDGTTLRAELRDAPIVEWQGLRRREVGRSADRTRRRYGEDLAALWREISGDPLAILELL